MKKRYAIVEGGTVVNIIIADNDTPLDATYFKIPDDLKVSIGWMWNGSNFLPAVDPSEFVPNDVSRFQARAALHIAGLLDDVEAAVAAAPDPLVRIAWADAQSFERSSPTIATLAAAIGLSDTQVDDLFIAAAKIRA